MWSTEDPSPSFSGFNSTHRHPPVSATSEAAERDSGELLADHPATAPVEPPAAAAPNVIPLPIRGSYPARGPTPRSTSGVQPPSRLARACRWLGISICLALCLPALSFSFFLFGFVLLPLLPLIGVSLVFVLGGSPPAPPARPHLPSAAAAARTLEPARAA